MFADECEELAYEVAFWMQGLEDPDLPLAEQATLTRSLCSHLRSLAIMVLLAFAKSDRFHHNLIRSARLRLAYLQRCRREDALEEHDYVSGVLEPLHDALAAGDWTLARNVAHAAPGAFRVGHEYADDFCYSQLLRMLIDGALDTASWTALLQRMELTLKGAADARLAVCRALGSRDQIAFDDAFEALIEARAAQIESDDQRGELAEPPALAQRAVFVDGLALLRVAQQRGLATAPEYRFCPSLARLPMVEPVPTD